MGRPQTSERAEIDVYITDELDSRAPVAGDSRAEAAAIRHLSALMAAGSSEVLPRFVELAMKLTDSVSAGLSLFECGENGAAGIFRWRHLHGALAQFEGAQTPRNFSPCGITLDRNGPVLSSHPERIYDWISDAGIVVPEVLLVPLYLGGAEPLGTLWVVSEREGRFTREHARLISELASLVGVAIRTEETERRLRQTIADQEMLVREMSHRVKNLFAVTNGLLRLSARGCATPQELVDRYSARLSALSRAHDLALRTETVSPGVRFGLAELIRVVLEPHDGMVSESTPRFSLAGADVSCGEHATNNVALVLHELATNATKYGALSRPDGRIDVSWRVGEEEIVLAWTEHGGPTLAGAPNQQGFGFTLAERTLQQIGGRLVLDWAREGLGIEMHLPVSALAA